MIYILTNIEYKNIENIKKYLSLFKLALLNRATKNKLIITEDLLNSTTNINTLYSPA
jgi:hypothetical protein